MKVNPVYYLFRPDTITTFAMFGFIIFMAQEPDLQKRIFMILPITLLFVATKNLFAMEFSKK